jgi:hypothetical protein
MLNWCRTLLKPLYFSVIGWNLCMYATQSDNIDWWIIYCFASRWRIFHTRAAEFTPISARRSGPLSREDSVSCYTAVKRGLGFSGLIRRTAPFSHLLRLAKECCWPILTTVGPHSASYDTQCDAEALFLLGCWRVLTTEKSFVSYICMFCIGGGCRWEKSSEAVASLPQWKLLHWKFRKIHR